jgi:hypothetical protein
VPRFIEGRDQRIVGQIGKETMNTVSSVAIMSAILVMRCPQHGLRVKTGARPVKAVIDSLAVAYVRYVKGDVLINGRHQDLSYNSSLHSGWVISLQKGPKDARLEFCYKNGDYICLTPMSRPYRLHPGDPSSLPNRNATRSAKSEGSERVFRSAGRTRSGNPIYSPAQIQAGAIWPDRFIIRWIPTKGNVSLKLYHCISEKPVGLPIWSSDVIEGMEGKCESHPARAVLRTIQAKKPDSELIVVMHLTNGDSISMHGVQFRLLSEAQHKTLTRSLSEADRFREPKRSILRASAYMDSGMYVDAADTIDAAVKREPSLIGLRFASIWAHRRTGNTVVADKLVKQLKETNTAVPDDPTD